jgi:hypothetical protein
MLILSVNPKTKERGEIMVSHQSKGLYRGLVSEIELGPPSQIDDNVANGL